MSVAELTVRTYQPWAQVLSYLQQHVGKLLHCQPIIMWHGEGWHMRSGRQVDSRSFYDVEFDDPKQAVVFALKWA
jgi:hypothetical protein